MSDAFIDTDVIIRLLTGDDLRKQAAAQALFQRVEAGSLILMAPDTVIADAVYVLASPRLYQQSRTDVRDLLQPLLRLAGIKVRNRRILLRALDLYAELSSGFGDAMIAATMERAAATTLYSYDEGFDRLPQITRSEP